MTVALDENVKHERNNNIVTYKNDKLSESPSSVPASMSDSLFRERSLKIKILTEQFYVLMNIVIKKYKPIKL